MPKQNVITHSGNRIVVRLDGQDVGLVQSCRMNDDYAPEPASGVGDIHVQEYVPGMARHSLSVSQMVLKRSNMRLKGITAMNADDMLKGLVFDIVTYDKDTGAELRRYVGCSFASGSVEVSKHAIVTAEAQFNALDVTGNGF